MFNICIFKCIVYWDYSCIEDLWLLVCSFQGWNLGGLGVLKNAPNSVYQGGRDFMSSLHSTFWFTPVYSFYSWGPCRFWIWFLVWRHLYNGKESTSHWYVLESSAICAWTWVLLIEKPTLHIPRLGAPILFHVFPVFHIPSFHKSNLDIVP